MNKMQKFNNQKERITKKFLVNRDIDYANSISGKVWVHTSQMINFWAKWDAKWNRIQKAFNSVWARISIQYN